MPLDRRDFLTGLAAAGVASALPSTGSSAAPILPASRRLLIVGPLPPQGSRAFMKHMLSVETWIFDEDGDRQVISAGFFSATFVKRPQAADAHALQLVRYPDYLPWDRSDLLAVGHAARFVARQATFIRTCRGHAGAILFHYPGDDPSDPYYNPHTKDFPVSLLSLADEV